MLVKNSSDQEVFFKFVISIISEFVAPLIKEKSKPFGLHRLRAVEFMAEAYIKFYRADMHERVFLNIYNTLLEMIEAHPLNTILH